MKAMLFGVVIVLVAGMTTWADGPKKVGTDPRMLPVYAEYSAKEAAQGKTRQELDAMIEEAADELDEQRADLQFMEATMKKLKEIRDGAKSGEPVRLEVGDPPQLDLSYEQKFRNVGVGRTGEGETDSDRLKAIEEKLGRILKELQGLKQ